MKQFLCENFLLKTETARALYHNYAEKLPIIDYHCHVNPREIAEDKKYANITEIWLGGDHYKWRAIRSAGIDEKYITGDASDYEKFRAFASIMPKLIGNPLYHWSHLELKRYFGYEGHLSLETCDEVWKLTSEKLADDSMSVKNIIKNSGVEVICTTDDPADTLEYHDQIAADKDFPVRVLPAFRPDKGLNLERPGYTEYIAKLSAAAGVEITDLESLKDAFRRRLDFFVSRGCMVSDHGIDNTVPFALRGAPDEENEILKKALSGARISDTEAAVFKTAMLYFFAEEYTKRGIVMQIHYGVNRNVNSLMFKKLGPDTGFDIIDGSASCVNLTKLLDLFCKGGVLPRTVIYSVNPADNALIASMIGAFQSGDGKGDGNGISLPRVMHGSAWWFNDNKTGMIEQMTNLANYSLFGGFLGMLTDSRSFLSYTRHEYFRRILCDLIGGWVENGEYPLDTAALAELVMDISYNNTKNFFGF